MRRKCYALVGDILKIIQCFGWVTVLFLICVDYKYHLFKWKNDNGNESLYVRPIIAASPRFTEKVRNYAAMIKTLLWRRIIIFSELYSDFNWANKKVVLRQAT